MTDYKQFFLDTLDDLRNKCESNSNYNYVKASALLRLLLIEDGIPLIHIVNREYKEKILFEVIKHTPSPRKHIGTDGLIYESFISVRFINPTASNDNIDLLNLDQFLKYIIFTYEGRDVTVLEILKLNAHVEGGVHLGNKIKKNYDELMIELANSSVNYTGGITGGAYSVHEIGKITLKALAKLEDRIKKEIELRNK